MKENLQSWEPRQVINYLESFVNDSGVLKKIKEGKDREGSDYTVYQTLGYFSIIGLLRLHCLLGDYYSSIKVLEPIDLQKKGLFTRVIGCHITLYYYLGFSYIMMRRYIAAIKAITGILLYISRTKQYHARPYQYNQITKKNEQMYYLLAIAVSLCPMKITDENIDQTLLEKCSDRMFRIQRGDDTAFKELFKGSCPKFVCPAPPDYSANPVEHNHKSAYDLQLKRFMHEVRQQELIRTVRSYLKLYTTISISKLATFLDADEDALKTNLLCYKHKTRNLVWNGGPPLGGEWMSSSDIDFHVDKDMVHIADTKMARRYGEYFIRNINKFEEVILQREANKH